MPCYNPRLAYRYYIDQDPNKSIVTFNKPSNKGTFALVPFNLPCGKCIGCRLNYAREWALRCMHEGEMHDGRNSFITLTFNKEHLPRDGSLNKATFQRFFKRLRAGLSKKNIYPRYFHSGEYGEKKGRPHYHALIFGYDFPDKKQWGDNTDYYTSEELKSYWIDTKTKESLGNHMIGNLTFESASYTARYILKKVKSDIDGSRGDKQPEYCTMSRNPGLGETWYKKFGWQNCHSQDRISVLRNGKTFYSRPPRYYDELLINEKKPDFYNPELYKKIKFKRKQNQEPPIYRRGKNGRLKTREEVKTLQIERMIRKLDVDS